MFSYSGVKCISYLGASNFSSSNLFEDIEGMEIKAYVLPSQESLVNDIFINYDKWKMMDI